MFLISQIGEPFYAYRLEKQEWKKDEKLDGFQFPFNVFDSVHGLFRRFALWQSSCGICMPGVVHVPYKRSRHVIWNKTPILVGDKLEDNKGVQTITSSENKYLRDSLLWRCVVEFGIPPKPQIPQSVESPAMLTNMMENNKALIKEIGAFFETFLLEVLPLCQVATSSGPQPVLSGTAPVKLSVVRQQFEQKMQQYLDKMEVSLWS